jgi:hypothetical protein
LGSMWLFQPQTPEARYVERSHVNRVNEGGSNRIRQTVEAVARQDFGATRFEERNEIRRLHSKNVFRYAVLKRRRCAIAVAPSEGQWRAPQGPREKAARP